MIAVADVECYIRAQVDQEVGRVRGLNVPYGAALNHTPFIPLLEAVRVPDHIKVPRIDPFDGKGDPVDFISHY